MRNLKGATNWFLCGFASATGANLHIFYVSGILFVCFGLEAIAAIWFRAMLYGREGDVGLRAEYTKIKEEHL